MKDEFNEIISDIIENKEFNELKNCKHHGITRYEHSMNVAYFAYKMTRHTNKNYKEITRAALLHDFFTDEVKEMWPLKKFTSHPKFALENSKKYFELNKLQEDIILSHMFPIGLRIPRYKESWLIDFIDDFSAIYEKINSVRRELTAAATFLFIVLMSYIK